jgi:hypothetical protein
MKMPGRGETRSPQERAEQSVNKIIAELGRMSRLKVTPAEAKAIGDHLDDELTACITKLEHGDPPRFVLAEAVKEVGEVA